MLSSTAPRLHTCRANRFTSLVGVGQLVRSDCEVSPLMTVIFRPKSGLCKAQRTAKEDAAMHTPPLELGGPVLSQPAHTLLALEKGAATHSA